MVHLDYGNLSARAFCVVHESYLKFIFLYVSPLEIYLWTLQAVFYYFQAKPELIDLFILMSILTLNRDGREMAEQMRINYVGQFGGSTVQQQQYNTTTAALSF